MKIYPEEIQAYRSFEHENSEQLLLLRPEVIKQVHKLAQEHARWLGTHSLIHRFINLLVLSSNWVVICWISFFLLPRTGNQIAGLALLAVVNGFFIYSLSNFSLHEGAAHKNIFRTESLTDRLLRVWVNWTPRFFFADPEYYRAVHFRHHQFLSQDRDGAFTHFVWPKRFLISLIPLAAALPFCDYKIHTGSTWSRSKVMSEITSAVFFLGIGWNAQSSIGWWSAVGFVVGSTTIAFWLDRWRESLEHQLMPSSYYGARSFGFNIIGLIIGGGPWGQPCHFIHHLAPGLAWYQQISMHYQIRKILNPRERELYYVEGFSQVIATSLRIIRLNLSYSRRLFHGSQT